MAGPAPPKRPVCRGRPGWRRAPDSGMIPDPSDRPPPVVRMGREKTILLGLLGLLAGVFVGVLSLKLLVPRPPTGTGPDIRAEVAVTTAQERVDPPTPSPGRWDFSAAPPLVPDPPDAPVPDAAPPGAEVAARPVASRFAVPAASRAAPPSAPDAETPEAEPASVSAPAAAPVVDDAVTPVAWQHAEPAPHAAVATPVAGDYVVRAGDSWWHLAERAYGDGRLYRALFAWNRSREPRITLAPGTRLDVPPLERLQATWPRLAAPR